MIGNFQPDTFTGFPFHHCNYRRLILILCYNNRIKLSMPEFLTGIDAFRTFLNAVTELLFILPQRLCPGFRLTFSGRSIFFIFISPAST